jgi:serine/threonine protein kinase/tetratricopeptide (TPR) repeat protein
MKCPACSVENLDDSKFCRECATPFPDSCGTSVSFSKTLELPVWDIKPGRIIAEKYRIIDVVGRGGMGVVYKAEDIKLKRYVALKFLPPELTQDTAARERFTQEARAASALDHNNICTIHEIGETDKGQVYISMAYYEGTSLKDRIAKGPLDVDESVHTALQLAEGLQKAHEKGIVHRDIKPANILFTNDGVPKILDFGLAKLGGDARLTKVGTTMGTVAYMSPEQARGEEADQRSDIWALGIVLYEMLSGQLPFKGEHEQTVVYSILNEPPRQLTDLDADIPGSIEQVVAKALEKDPDERYQTLAELLEDLRSISGGREPEGIKVRLRKARLLRKKRAIVYAGLAGFSLIVTVIAIGLFTGRSTAIDAIAVLPLKNLTGDPDQEYFSDGITDALINELAKIGALRVISRQSVMRYKGSEMSLPAIARELNVDAIVEASVLNISGRVQIRAQLIQAPSEQNLWARSYEREISDILALQSEMAQTIAREIKVNLTPIEETRLSSTKSVNPEAYEAYLKGQFHWYKLTSKDLETALQYFELALQKDPDSALAYSGIANVWIGRMAMGLVPTSEGGPKAKAAAVKALEMDSNQAEVHYSLALVAWLEWDWVGAWEAFRQAIMLNSNHASARAYYSHFLHVMGRSEEAMEQVEKALNLDPFNPLFQALYAMDLMYARRYDEVIELLLNTLKSSPNDPVALSTLRSAYHQKQMHEEALEIWKKSYAAKGDHEAVEALSLGYSENGYSGALSRVAETLIMRSRNTSEYVTPWQIGTLYTRAGKIDEALEWLEKAYDEHDSNMPYLRVDPIFDILRDEPRFQDLIRRMKFPDKE